MKNILLIAGLQEQYYFQPFVDACSNRDISIHLCDPSRYPTDATFCITQDKTGRTAGNIETIRLRGTTYENTSIDFSNIHTASYLRENYTQTPVNPADIEAKFAHNETRQALRAIFSVLKCKWINSREAMGHIESNKLYQQLVAAQCGLLVPRTILSNTPTEVVKFSTPGNGLLLKSIGYTKLDDAGNCVLYSERFSHKEIANNAVAIRACPIYGQEYVEKRYEYRVMVIGEQVLSCRIDSQASAATKVDWRHYDFENVEHKQVDLPNNVQANLLRFMKAVGLHYGAIDLIETPEGNFIFLEVNPSGQWGWVADLAGLPIPKAVADMLEVF